MSGLMTWDTVRDDATGAALAVPADWERLAPPSPAVLAVAWPAAAVASGEFRANVAVTVEPVPPHAQDLRVYSPNVVEGFLATMPDAYVVAVDVYPLPGCRDGRQMIGVYRQDGHAIVLSQYWIIVSGLATAVSASCRIDRFATLDRVFDGCLHRFEPATSPPPEPRDPSRPR